jgi:hypothetical protein
MNNFPGSYISHLHTLELSGISTESGEDASDVFDKEHLLVFDNLLIVDCSLLTGIVNEYCNQKGYYDSQNLGMSVRFGFSRLKRDRSLDATGRHFRKFDLF